MEDNMEIRKGLFLGLALLMIGTLTTGCKKIPDDVVIDNSPTQAEEVNLEESYAMEVGETKVYYNEIMVYVLLLKQEYEPSLGSEVWDFTTSENEKFAEMAKEDIIDQITELKIITNEAKNLGIELDEDEKEIALTAANTHYDAMSQKAKKDYGITLGTLIQVYEDNLLATKVFESVTVDIDTEVPDEEAKQIKVWQIKVNTTKVTKDGTVTPYTTKEKDSALKKARKLLKSAKKTEDFYQLAKESSESEEIEVVFGKGDREKVIEDISFGLKEGEISDVAVTEDGFYILYCVSEFDEDATADKKEDIIVKRQMEMFQTIYEGWLDEYPVVVHEKVWNFVSFAA